MRYFQLFPALALAIGLLGCASNGQMQKLESTSETNTKLLRENEHRLRQLETSVSSLNSQVAQLNNRVYEVRNRNGKKTSMTVVPIIPPAPAQAAPAATAQGGATPPAAAAAPAATAPVAQATHPNSRAEALLASARRAAAERNQAAQGAQPGAQAATPGGGTAGAPVPSGSQQPATAQSAPKGRMIDPAAAPTPIPAPNAAQRAAKPAPTAQRSAGASGSLGQPETVAGPSGTLSAQRADVPAALPPIGLPPTTAPAGSPAPAPLAAPAASPAGSGTTGGVPVPAIPASSLALPPEHPGLPPMGQSQGAPTDAVRQGASVPVPTPAPTPAPTATPAATPAPARAANPRGEEAAYKAALNATLAGKTQEGIRLFRDFLQEYPHGRYTANADYWIGECLYAQGKYQDALAQFQKVNDSYPQHHKNADALLKAGMTMSRLGDKTAAAEKYRALMAQFPNSDAARRARAMGVAR